MARAMMMACVAGSVACMPSTVKAAPSVRSAMVSSFSGRALKSVSVRQGASLGDWQSLQIRAQTTAQREKVVTGDDIIDKVKNDHRELEEYFQNYKNAHKQGHDMEARKWFNQFVWEISRHAVCEELILYPMLANLGEKGQKLADQSREDHHKTKEILAELQTTVDMDKFDEKMDKMMADLNSHIKMEENEDLTYLEQNTDADSRVTAGKTFALGKNIVPTQPHPAVPEKLVALEAALGLLITPLDKLRDFFTPFPAKKDTLN